MHACLLTDLIYPFACLIIIIIIIRYHNIGVKVRASTSRRYSDLIPTFKSNPSVPENQSSDPTEVISPSRARAMLSQMEQTHVRAMSPDSQRSNSPKHSLSPRHTSPLPKHTPSPPRTQENHEPKEMGQSVPENKAEQNNDTEDHSMPYKDLQRVRICDPIPE